MTTGTRSLVAATTLVPLERQQHGVPILSSINYIYDGLFGE